MFPDPNPESTDTNGVDDSRLKDPREDRLIQLQDARQEFEQLTRQQPRDIAAERAFIKRKIKVIQQDSHLSADEKAKAIQLLRGKFSR